MGVQKNADYKVHNGVDFDTINFKTIASQVKTNDGSNVETVLSNKANRSSFIKVSAGTGQIAANGQITKVQLQNIIDRTPGIIMSNYGVVVPENCNKALVEFCSGWGTGVSGDLEHRLFIAQTTADTVGVNQLQYRDGRRTPASPSLESIIHSSFTVEGLLPGNVLYMDVVQITGGSVVIGNSSYMRVTFYI